jgi:hypothetical protein
MSGEGSYTVLHRLGELGREVERLRAPPVPPGQHPAFESCAFAVM